MNPSPQLSPSLIHEAAERLARCPEVVAAYLHGSAAKGALRADSDVDIALLLHPKAHLAATDRLGLAADLETLFRREVDVGLLSPRNLVYAAQVAAYGQLIFTRDAQASDGFFAHSLSGYARLQEDRAPILARYAA